TRARRSKPRRPVASESEGRAARLHARISRRSGYRFSGQDMRQRTNLERIPIPSDRVALQRQARYREARATMRTRAATILLTLIGSAAVGAMTFAALAPGGA